MYAKFIKVMYVKFSKEIFVNFSKLIYLKLSNLNYAILNCFPIFILYLTSIWNVISSAGNSKVISKIFEVSQSFELSPSITLILMHYLCSANICPSHRKRTQSV